MAGALDWQQQQQCQHQWMPPRVCSQLHNSTARQCMRSFHGALRQWEVAGQQWVQEAVQQDRLHSTKALSKTAADSPPPHTHTHTHPPQQQHVESRHGTFTWGGTPCCCCPVRRHPPGADQA